jgi:cell wall-associated NlpC family hydrolase
VTRSTRWAAALLLGGLLASGLPVASATPIGDARSQAAALRVKVDTLRKQAEIATEQYDAAYAELGKSVTAHLTAQKALQNATAASGVSDDIVSRRVRALYMAGGTPALYAKVLDSSTITEVGQRIDQVKMVLQGDKRATDTANTALVGRQDAERRLAAAAAASTKLQTAVGARADKVRELLAQTDALLAAADTRVRDLAEQQRRAAEAAAAARAAAELARAQALGGGVLPPVAASPLATLVLAFAQTQLGKPYVWGATGPASYDCSGLTGAAYAAAGIRLPRVAADQWNAGPHVALADLQPGDLMFWASDLSNSATIHHVAIYAGNGLMVAAPHTGDVVKVQPIYLDGYMGANRPGATLAVP